MCAGIHSDALDNLQTIENTREKDETMVTANDEEVAADEEQDEFSGVSPPTYREMRFHMSTLSCEKYLG